MLGLGPWRFSFEPEVSGLLCPPDMWLKKILFGYCATSYNHRCAKTWAVRGRRRSARQREAPSAHASRRERGAVRVEAAFVDGAARMQRARAGERQGRGFRTEAAAGGPMAAAAAARRTAAAAARRTAAAAARWAGAARPTAAAAARPAAAASLVVGPCPEGAAASPSEAPPSSHPAASAYPSEVHPSCPAGRSPAASAACPAASCPAASAYPSEVHPSCPAGRSPAASAACPAASCPAASCPAASAYPSEAVAARP